MKSAEEKAEVIRNQVLSKVQWGANESEVREWLEKQQNISGEEADQLVEAAFRSRARSFRIRVLGMLIISGLGVFVFAAYYWKQYQTGIKGTPVQTIGVGLLGSICVLMFFRSLARLISGNP